MNQRPKKFNLSFNSCFNHLKKFNLLESDTYQLHTKGEKEEFSSITTDSRKISENSIFIAYKGLTTDGHDYLAEAAKKKVKLIILEDESRLPSIENPDLFSNINWIKVKDGRGAWSVLSSLQFGSPEKSLNIFGVTGTNGKTTVTWMFKELMRINNITCLSIGTVGIYFGDDFTESNHTTPDPDILYELLALARDKNISTVIMEVSSHAIAQSKLLPIRFNGGVFTSFSRDHLDYHKTMEEYFQTKASFFTNYLNENSVSIIHKDLFSQFNIKTSSKYFYSYGITENTEDKSLSENNITEPINVDIIKHFSTHTQIKIHIVNQEIQGSIPYLARHNVENFTAAFLLAYSYFNYNLSAIKIEDWLDLKQVPGRMNILKAPTENSNKPAVIVDYAHTPNALQKLLETVKEASTGTIWVVFGCGGDRDKGKRPIMAEIAEGFADHVIITNDNPRNESPQEIIEQIMRGFKNPEKILVEPDREKAISYAILHAKVGDTVVLAGKGHESYQIIGNTTYNFDDHAIAMKYLQ
ncbi:MAG: UDP-N-acetylmuramoyl-L-alanyl-D-glutamate--2,6-diaminopimelate ligase [Bdellovibrionota bacterium]